MKNAPRRSFKNPDGGTINIQVRKKLGVSQEKFAYIFDVSRPNISHLEWGRRSGSFVLNATLANIHLRFHELETGARPASRSVETKLFLNEEYKKVLPQMEAMEKDYRARIKALKKQMEAMKEKARDAEHSIIVLTDSINDLKQQDGPDSKTEINITGLELLKQDVYNRLLTCWEPEQAKLHAKIEAIAGEAKALRRYRTKVVREHDPFGKNKGSGRVL